MSTYPRDEFDAVEENSARHGVHRASMEIQGRSLVPLMIVGVAALCIGLLAFFVMPRMLGSTPLDQVVAVGSTSAPATTAPATTAPATLAPTPAPTTAPVETPSPTPTPTSVLDKSIPVAIFNSVGIPGLASRYSGLVMAQGWTVSQSANWAGQPQGTSVIFYSGLAQEANAESLSAALNIPTLVDTAELGIPLAIVLGPGA